MIEKNTYDYEMALRSAILGAIAAYGLGDKEAITTAVGAVVVVLFDILLYNIKTWVKNRKVAK